MSPRLTVIFAGPAAGEDLARCAPVLSAAIGADAVELLNVGDAPDRAAAINAAATSAAGDVLVLAPPGIVVEPAMPAQVVAMHGGAGDVVGVGAVVPAAGRHPLALARYRRDAATELPDLADCAGQLVTVAAETFRRVGGLATGLAWGGEVDLIHRLGAHGVPLRRYGEPLARRARPTTLRDAIRERLAAGAGSVALYRREPALLPHLELGGFHAGQPPGLALRRLLLAIGGPPLPVALGGLLRSGEVRGRWLRFQSEYHFWRGARRSLGSGPMWRSLARPPVILMYHAIGRGPERPGTYVVPIARFRRQLQWLRLRRYRIIGLERLLEYRQAHELPPPRSVVITFDDGYLDNRELAAAALRTCRFTATFFVVSRAIEGRNSWDRRGELAGRWMLSWPDVRSLLSAGMTIGAHTRTHPVLPELPPEEQRWEVAGARQDLEYELGRPILTFAYPYGRLDGTTTATVAEGGYAGACCSRSGVNDPSVPPFLLRRVEVRGTDSLLRFALAVHRGWTPRRRAG